MVMDARYAREVLISSMDRDGMDKIYDRIFDAAKNKECECIFSPRLTRDQRFILNDRGFLVDEHYTDKTIVRW